MARTVSLSSNSQHIIINDEGYIRQYPIDTCRYEYHPYPSPSLRLFVRDVEYDVIKTEHDAWVFFGQSTLPGALTVTQATLQAYTPNGGGGGGGGGTSDATAANQVAGNTSLSNLETRIGLGTDLATATTITGLLKRLVQLGADDRDLSELLVIETTGLQRLLVRQRVYNEDTGVFTTTFVGLDGSSALPVPTGPFKLAANDDIELRDFHYHATVANAGNYAVGDHLVLTQLIETKTGTVTNSVWFNLSAGVVPPSVNLAELELEAIDDDLVLVEQRYQLDSPYAGGTTGDILVKVAWVDRHSRDVVATSWYNETDSALFSTTITPPSAASINDVPRLTLALLNDIKAGSGFHSQTRYYRVAVAGQGWAVGQVIEAYDFFSGPTFVKTEYSNYTTGVFLGSTADPIPFVPPALPDWFPLVQEEANNLKVLRDNNDAMTNNVGSNTAPTKGLQLGGQFLSTPATLTNGQNGFLTLTKDQRVRTDVANLAASPLFSLISDGTNLTTLYNTAVQASAYSLPISLQPNTYAPYRLNTDRLFNQPSDGTTNATIGTTVPASGVGALRVTLARESWVAQARGNGAVTNSSIATAGISQEVFAASATRSYFEIQNTSASALWVQFGAAAGVNNGFRLAAGASYTSPANFTPDGSINIWGATAGLTFAASQG